MSVEWRDGTGDQSAAAPHSPAPHSPATGVFSILSRARLIARPPVKPPIVPPPARTRWHGITIGIGLRPRADPTARAACGTPIARATEPYDPGLPSGMSRVAVSTALVKGVCP